MFFMRLEFTTASLNVSLPALEQNFSSEIAERFEMGWKITHSNQPKKVTILVSKYDHALLELLWRHANGELPCVISQIISNHLTLKPEADRFGIPYHHVVVDKENKAYAESQILALMKDKTDLAIMARYMQILSNEFVSHYPGKIINIHHSFLPAFIGANPYKQAHVRGVKIIGATAHYATQDLDEGPIIEQGVARVSHKNSVKDLVRIGRDLERTVLATAVKWHLEDRVIVHGNKTVVFE